MHTPTAFGDLRVLAIDPGGVTGWLLFRPVVDTETPTGLGLEPLKWGEEPDQMKLLNMVWTLTSQPDPTTRRSLDAIVIEGWWPRPGVMTWQPEAVEIIGTCRWMLADDPGRYYIQKVGDAVSFGTPAKIDRYRRNRAAPFNVGKGGEGHAVKALQHAILWTCTRWSPERPQ